MSRNRPISPPPHPHHSLQHLLIDNQRLAATHVALKQELSIALQDLRHLSAAAGKVKAERAAEVRGVAERVVKMEAEVGLVDELRAEVVKVRGDVCKLGLENKEFGERFKKVYGEVVKERPNKERVEAVKREIEAVKQEIQRGRAAIEYEKKVYDANIEQSEAMEKSRVSLAREIEKLKADLATANKKAMAAAAAAATNTPGTVYGAGYGNHDMAYAGNAYPGPFPGHQVHGVVDPRYVPGPMPPQGPYDMHHHMVNPHYAPRPHGPYDMQHPNAHG